MFPVGNAGGPGRPIGSVGGRARALQTLDAMMGDERNVAKLHEALQVEFDKNPVRFFRDLVMPLLPRHATLETKAAEPVTIKWVSLLERFPRQGTTEKPVYEAPTS